MIKSFNHDEKKALLAIVKFLIAADGFITDAEVEKCGKLAEEKGFEDFSSIFNEVDKEIKSVDDVLALAEKVREETHEQDIIKIAIDIAEADANIIDDETSFIKNWLKPGASRSVTFKKHHIKKGGSKPLFFY